MENNEVSILSNIIELTRDEDMANVNQKLSEGWVLLKIYTIVASYSESDQTAVYVFGRPKGI